MAGHKKPKPKRRAGTPRSKMRKTTDAERDVIVTEIEMAIARGLRNEEILRRFMAEKGIPSRSLSRHIAEAHKRILVRCSRRRSILVAQQNAKLEHAQRLALSATKAVTYHQTQFGEDGKPSGTVQNTRDVPSPDLMAFARLNEAQQRLLGLNAPNRHEIVVHNLNLAMRKMMNIVHSYVPDPRQRRRLVEELRLAAAEDLTRRPGLVEGDGEVVDAEVTVSKPVEKKANGRRNGNGRKNGT